MADSPLYLVTGGAGFIGSHLVSGLLRAGRRVRVLDNFSSGRRENLQVLQGDLQVLEADIRDPEQIRAAADGTDVILHEAAFVSVPQSMQDPQACLDVNVGGTAMLLDAARRAGVRRVVLASSAAVYGDSTDLPLREDTAARPQSPYALSKRINEMYATMFSEQFGMQVVALRYFNVFGSRQRPDTMYAAAIPNFIGRLTAGKRPVVFGDGKQSRDLIHVHDVVRANMIAAEHPNASGKIFNVCTGRETALLDILEVLSEFFPNAKDPEYEPTRPGDIYRSVGDPSLAGEMLNFASEVSLSEGLREVVASMSSD